MRVERREASIELRVTDSMPPKLEASCKVDRGILYRQQRHCASADRMTGQ